MPLKSFRTFLDEALLDVDASDVTKIYAPIKDVMSELTAVWNRNYERFVSASAGSSAPGVPSSKAAIARTISREMHETITKYQPIINNPVRTFSSASLKSENAKKAHAVNPIEIHVWVVSPRGVGNHYAPSKKAIHISLDWSVADAMLNRLEHIPSHQLPMLKNEVSELKHKSTIRHELTHWIDDSLHNFYITKSLNNIDALTREKKTKQAEIAYKKDLSHNQPDVYLSPVEINAMVNQIAEYKRRIGNKKYDALSWYELMIALPSLGTLNSKFGSKWRQKMFERMSREGLIGKNFQVQLKTVF
jgi:hypothetical protein